MIPKSWRKGKVLDFFELQRGFDLTEKQAQEGQIPVISSSGLSYYHNEAKVNGPGVITGRKGKIGNVIFMEGDFWPHDTSLWVKDFKGNYPKFIYYFLQAMNLERYDEASSVPTLNRNNVHRILCQFPPVVEQEKITLIFDTWTKVIEKTARMIVAKEKQYTWLINKLIREENRNWRKEKLENLVLIQKGVQLNVANMVDTGDYYALNGGIEPSGFTNNWNIRENTITISEGGNSCGFVNFNIQKFWCGGHCYALNNVCDFLDVKYLYYFLKARERHLMSLRVGSGLPNIQKKDLQNIFVYFPSLINQRKISDALDMARYEIDIRKKQLEAYRKQQHGLMQKLLTGQWRVKTSKGI